MAPVVGSGMAPAWSACVSIAGAGAGGWTSCKGAKVDAMTWSPVEAFVLTESAGGLKTKSPATSERCGAGVDRWTTGDLAGPHLAQGAHRHGHHAGGGEADGKERIRAVHRRGPGQ